MSDEELPDKNVKRPKSKVCNSNCINFKCYSGIDMKLAPSFACAFYGVIDKKEKKRVICKQCFNAALQHQKVKIFNSLYKISYKK